ncbi:MAG: serine hydrolase domain-containing protein, partial [Flavisolibacter sp.]
MRLKFLVALLLIVSVSNSQLNFQKSFPAIDRYVDSLMKDWNLPGMALAIVYKDQLIYSKGYGFRDLEQKLPVQTNTLFPIASNSKLFTATLAAMLAVAGKMNLDKPVRSYLPSLNFYSDDLNARVTMRDMLSHRTGLPRYDFIWVGNEGSRKDAVSKVAYMKPQLGLREGYIYNNMMYATAGLVIETVTG